MSIFDIAPQSLWIASSVKPKHEICNVIDGNPKTFWQSDGSLPHVIIAMLPKISLLKSIEILTDYILDESYTPYNIIFRVGLCRNILFDICKLGLNGPQGWISIPVTCTKGGKLPIKFLQICITSNYQDGRDSRIRGIKILVESIEP